jgi:hypothetical protein
MNSVEVRVLENMVDKLSEIEIDSSKKAKGV